MIEQVFCKDFIWSNKYFVKILWQPCKNPAEIVIIMCDPCAHAHMHMYVEMGVLPIFLLL